MSNRAVQRLAVGAAILCASVLGWRFLGHEASYRGKPTSYWVKQALSGDHSPPTLAALESLEPEPVALLLKALKRRDSKLKTHWLWLYGKLPGTFQQFFHQPVSDRNIRDNAYMVLNRVSWSIKGPAARNLLPELTRLLSDDDPRPSGAFVDARTFVAIPHGRFVRAIAADLLATIGPDATAAVPALMEALEDEKWKKDQYYLIPRALGKIGPSANAAIPALTRVLNSGDSNATVWAAEALWRIDPMQASIVVPTLEQALSHTNRFARVKAARVHWMIKRQATVVVPVLLELMADPENHWVVDTMRALEDIGPDAKVATPALVERLTDKDSVVRQVATEVLKKINPDSKAGMKWPCPLSL